ncbi:LysR family transcriptional regulator [Chitinasiproducens palmae]|uniref:DNA-binding transcriptional regulator, LysR family n=1 Tax=Chitinasiproducens palmae TaxID=1770053 RepID=A0A1H2PKN8_9BURK|nr:LysR family transcriptional regulator [Chitinasiproducens palmae]SDV46986.1 DNA-binding transcriptional regulator, LysR family [Chitinasiproducens palmae]
MPSLDHIDLNLLRVFMAIVEEESLTGAGRRLGLSQPAISYSLGRLRAVFDDPLFVRTRSRMQPTPKALELSKIVARALESVREALRHAERFDPATSSRTFRVALSDAGELAYLPRLCEVLHREAPHVRLESLPSSIETIVERLRSSRLDFAIGNLPGLMAETENMILFDEDYVCMRRRHGAAHRSATRRRSGEPDDADARLAHADYPLLSMQTYRDATHLRVSSLEQSHGGIDVALHARGVKRNVALDLSHFASVPRVLRVTDHVATLPRRLAEILREEGDFEIFALPVRLPRVEITLHWHAHFAADDGNAWFRTRLNDVMQMMRS